MFLYNNLFEINIANAMKLNYKHIVTDWKSKTYKPCHAYKMVQLMSTDNVNELCNLGKILQRAEAKKSALVVQKKFLFNYKYIYYIRLWSYVLMH